MRVLVQRSKESSVKTDNITNKIKEGMVLFVGFKEDDGVSDIDYLVKKIINLRIFDDENGVMNKSILDMKYEILSISQFTLYAECKKGNRPSYSRAMKYDKANEYYNLFNDKLGKYVPLKTGVFGAEMLVNINNDGPITILLES